jgi:hypothetical protein
MKRMREQSKDINGDVVKRVLVYPCGTEIGLEIHRALKDSTKYELIGGSSSYDHGRFVYKEHIDNLPFITDHSSKQEIVEFNQKIAEYKIDIIYPVMDGVITIFSKYKDYLEAILVSPNKETTAVTRSKKTTYEAFDGLLPIPCIYSKEDIISGKVEFPIFIKPDVGQGSVGTAKISSVKEYLDEKKDDDSQLYLEYLPGQEYTVDCFTNNEGKLIYCKGRSRKRIKNGISVNAVFIEDSRFQEFARVINNKLQQKGAWFYQLKEDKNGQLKLLEIASRIAGTSAITRNIGVNLPLLTVNLFSGISCDEIVINHYNIELDRALENRFITDISFDTVYIDYDDTIVKTGVINTNVIKFLYQCINQGKKIVLLTKHDGNLQTELKKYRLSEVFDRVVHLDRNEKKSDYIDDLNAIFIDDSYGERKAVYDSYGISVFDVNMLECLLEN